MSFYVQRNEINREKERKNKKNVLESEKNEYAV